MKIDPSANHGMRECPGCAVEVPANENRCPVCGYAFPARDSLRRRLPWIAPPLLFLFLLPLLASLGRGC